MSVFDRVRIYEPEMPDDLLNDLIMIASDRICIKVGESHLPPILESVAVLVVRAMYNKARANNEGIQSESVDTFSVTFVDNILAEFEGDFEAYRAQKANETNEYNGVVRFI